MTRFAAAAFTALALFFAGAPASAVTIGFAPATQTVPPGDFFTVDVVVSDLAGEVVAAYDLDLVYDAAILSATTVSFGPLLGDGSASEVFEDFDLTNPGVVDFAQLSLLSDADLLALQPGAFVLATIGFQALSPGTSPLELVFDAGNGVTGLGGQGLGVDAPPGSVDVVPEPGATLLVVLGAAVVSARTRSRS